MEQNTSTESKSYYRNKKFLKVFLITFLTLSLLASVFVFYSYNLQKKQVISRISEYYTQILYSRASYIRSVVNPVVSNLNYLAQHNTVVEYMANNESSDKLLEDMRLFAQNNIYYKQVRFIDSAGLERIRINWDANDVSIVPDSSLQDKSDRYYFIETMKLSPEAVYISPIDLNIEFGKIQVPHQLVIRVAKKVVDKAGNARGVIVVNLYLEELLIRFFEKDVFDRDNFHFLNSDGYWIQGPTQFTPLGFMFDSLKTENFGNYYPDIWNEINSAGFGSFESENGLCLFRHVKVVYNQLQPSDDTKIESPARDWVFTYLIDYKKISELVSLRKTVLWLSVLAFFIVCGLSYIIAHLRTKELLYISALRFLNEDLEQRIQERTKELSKKNLELENANEELEAFTYSVSHDLRAPLRHIAGFAELLKKRHREKLDKEGANYIDYVTEASSNMGHLIDDLLQLSRVGRGEILEREINVEELVLDCSERLDKEHPNLKIRWEIGSIENVVADYNLLKQVWLNLLGNAVKYSSKREESIIEVKSIVKDHFVVFSVKDNGIGFDDAYKDKLFAPFQRLHSSEDFEGTGIGLAIVRRIIARFGGRIWAESELNNGATFSFMLPIK